MESNAKIRIDVPDIYKQVDDSVWEELETYIYRCFLTSSSIVADHSIIFKTLNHDEIQNIRFHKPIQGSSEEVQRNYRATFIAYSIFMIDGENILPNRSSNIRNLVNIFEKIDSHVLLKIINNLSYLNRKASRLHPLTEAYIYENRSRFKWFSAKGTLVNSPLLTGIPGSDQLGMNYCQQTWSSLNHIHDLKDEIEREWSNAKFIGSCFNGKGVRSIEEKDRGRREQERLDQEELKIKVLHGYLNRDEYGNSIDIPEEITLPDGRKALVDNRKIATTVDELAEQLSSSLSGEKDAHDIIIEKALSNIQKKREDAEKNKLSLYTISNVDHDDSSVSSVLPGGKAEANSRVMRLRGLQLEQRRRAFSIVKPEINAPDDSEK